jgi:hypothetical protein
MIALGHWLRDGKSFVWRIYLAALILRLIPVLLASNLGIGLDDMFQYDMLARSIVSGNGFRWYAQGDLDLIQQYIKLDLTNVAYDPRGLLTTFRAPLYPAFLAVIYFFAGIGPGRFFAARLAQVFLDACLAPLAYLTARRLFPANESAAGMAAWVIACYPMLIIYPLALATENLFFVLVLAGFLLLLKAVDKPSILNFIFAGITFGLAALTRSIILFAAGLIVLWVWFVLRERRGALALCLAMAAVILPWVVRNSLASGHLTSVETSLGYNLYVGYHPESSGTFTYGPSLDLLTILDDSTRDQVGTQKALEFIRQDPARVPYLAVLRLGYFFNLERRALTYFYSNGFLGYIPLPLLLLAAFILLMPFIVVTISAALGLAVIPWRRGMTLSVLLFTGYLLPHVLILAEDRFHLALVPLFAIVAARFWTGGLGAISIRWSESRVGKVALMLAGLAVLLLFLNWGAELYHDADKIALLLGPNGNQAHFTY